MALIEVQARIASSMGVPRTVSSIKAAVQPVCCSAAQTGKHAFSTHACMPIPCRHACALVQSPYLLKGEVAAEGPAEPQAIAANSDEHTGSVLVHCRRTARHILLHHAQRHPVSLILHNLRHPGVQIDAVERPFWLVDKIPRPQRRVVPEPVTHPGQRPLKPYHARDMESAGMQARALLGHERDERQVNKFRDQVWVAEERPVAPLRLGRRFAGVIRGAVHCMKVPQDRYETNVILIRSIQQGAEIRPELRQQRRSALGSTMIICTGSAHSLQTMQLQHMHARCDSTGPVKVFTPDRQRRFRSWGHCHSGRQGT